LERAKQASPGEKPVAPGLPETTKAMANYLDLHRHALVRLALCDAPSGVILRLAVAQIVAGSNLWRVKPDEQTARTDAIAASLKAGSADTAFTEKRRGVLFALGLPEYHLNVVRHYGTADESVAIFAELLLLPDETVTSLLAFVLAESLEAGTSLVEAVGDHLGVKAEGQWRPDETFFELIRDRAVVGGMLAEVAGKPVADANVAEKIRVQKAIIRDCLAGENGRAKIDNWVPRYMAFPPRAYTERGGVPAVDAWNRAQAAYLDRRAV
jgi:ParB family chromosome partitioning protein